MVSSSFTLSSSLSHGLSYSLAGSSSLLVNGMGGGQSLIVQMDDSAFITASGAGSQFVDGAVNGSAITKTVGDQNTTSHWVNDSGALADGTDLISYLALVDANYASRTDVNVVIWQQWNESRSLVTDDGLGAGEITPAEYKTAFEYLVTRWKAEHGADVKIIIGLPHRRTSGTAQENYGCQQMRQAYIDVATSDTNISIIESSDIDLVDATHMTVAGRTEFGSRFGNMANAVINGTTLPDYPILTSASTNGYGGVVLGFDSDITQPSAGVGQLAVEQNGVVKTGSTLIRSASATGLFTLADNEGIRIDDSPFMRIGSGVNAGLASTSADTLNNSTGTLPARGARIVITDANVISQIAGVSEFIDAKYSTKTFSAGTSVTTIEGIKGAGFTKHTNATNTETDYVSGAFANGRGGLKAIANTACLQNITPFTAGNAHTIAYSIVVPASPSGSIRMHQFGLNNLSSNTNTSTFANGANISYGKNQGGGFPTIFAGATGGEHVICIRYNSLSSVDCFIDGVLVTTNFDPNDGYSIYQHLHLFATGGGADGLLNGIYGSFVYANSALSNGNVSTIINELGSEFGITIS